MDFGLQLYSVRDITENDLSGALMKVSELGYKFVEFAGFFGHGSGEILNMLMNSGLYATGTHSSASGLKPENITESIKFHKEIFCKDYIIPGADLSTGAKLSDFIKLVNYAQPILEEEGIRLHFHNHYSEFLPNKDGRYAHYELEKNTKINFEIDTYWAHFAGRDPVALMERLKDRISVIHVKDGIGKESKSLGEGDAPVADVIKKAEELGFRMIVESEGLCPTGLSEVGRCAEFLKNF